MSESGEGSPLVSRESEVNDDVLFDGEEVDLNEKVEEPESPEEEIEKPVSLSILKIALLTVSFSGCIMCWSVEIAYGTAFLEELGLSKRYVSYNWMIGPLSALFIQPIVGIVSDKLFIPFIGRRKPFLAIGTALCAVCLILFSWCDVISSILFGYNKKLEKYFAIGLALVSFCILDGSINTLHSAIKTLTIDQVPVHQQTSCNLFLSFFAGLGNTLGFAVGYIDFVGRLKMKFLKNNIRPVWGFCVIWLIVSCSLTFFTTWEKRTGVREKPKEEAEEELNIQSEKEEEEIIETIPSVTHKRSFGENVYKKSVEWKDGCFKFWKDFPDHIIRVYWVRFFIYFAKFFCFVYMSDYVGRQIYHGEPDGTKKLKDRFDAGVRFSSLCFSILSMFNMINSPIINFLSRIFPIRVVWGVAQSSQFFGLIACYWVRNRWILAMIFYFLSLMETCCISFPYAILNASVKKSKYLKRYKGLVAGIFVSSQCFPEIMVSVLGGVMVRVLIDMWGMNPGVMIACGGICGGIALTLILFIKIPEGMVTPLTWKEVEETAGRRWDNIITCCGLLKKKDKTLQFPQPVTEDYDQREEEEEEVEEDEKDEQDKEKEPLVVRQFEDEDE